MAPAGRWDLPPPAPQLLRDGAPLQVIYPPLLQVPASAEEQQQQQEKQQAAEEQRSSMLAMLLQPAARDRRELRVPSAT